MPSQYHQNQPWQNQPWARSFAPLFGAPGSDDHMRVSDAERQAVTDRLAEHFGSRCRAVCRIPFDPHLEEGAEIELERLAGPTRTALLELGATVADDFPNDMNRR